MTPPPARAKPVEWLAPSVLARSAAEVFFSGLFAGYADKRETESGLSDETFAVAPGAEGTLWLDYASDVGDGFDATFLIARLMAEPSLTVEGEETMRGAALVLGGDQVYPSASLERYEERFRGPYATAFPEVPGLGDAARPSLFALPGNHDWYDGLTSFMRVFCQGASIGNWRTRQKRSYFALELAHGWWLWGIDSQFDAYIDAPQLAYFEQAAAKLAGGQVILATAKPSWIKVRPSNPRPQSWQTLAYIRERVIGDHGTLALTITGDLHHYSRYATAAGDGPKVTAGGGGAYLSATHWLPGELRLPPLEPDSPAPAQDYSLAMRWPDAATSRDMRRGVLRHLLPSETPSLNVLLAAIYGVFALILAAGVKDQGTDLQASLEARSGISLLGDAVTVWSILLAVVLWRALVAFGPGGRAGGRAGTLHAAVQLAAVTGLTLIGLEWGSPGAVAETGFWLGYLVAAAVAVAGAIVGRVLLVLYLFAANRFRDRWHVEEVFAAQSRRAGVDHKHFVRFRIAAEGLTMWVIGVHRVPRDASTGAPLPELTLVDRLEIPARGAS